MSECGECFGSCQYADTPDDCTSYKSVEDAGQPPVCRCGHGADRHDGGVKTPTHDTCAGGAISFCGCRSYRPAPSSHDITVHSSGPTHYWITCSCGWSVDPVSNNWAEWSRLSTEHCGAGFQRIACESRWRR